MISLLRKQDLDGLDWIQLAQVTSLSSGEESNELSRQTTVYRKVSEAGKRFTGARTE
jgi:hypothetical protein